MRRSANHIQLDRAFGRELREFLYREDIFEILGNDGTWQAGGCWILAEALRRLLGAKARLKMVSSDASKCEHVVVQVGALFIHASGVMSEGELLTEMRCLERLANPRLTDLDEDCLKLNEVPQPDERSTRLFEELTKRFH